ncbi:MAG: pyridoxamine 5'-phosphate oxidase family protein [Allorhizobium sp.]
MSDLTLHDISKKMAKLDFAMLNTSSRDGGLTSRPMSNNGDVEYDGDSYFFAYEQSRKIAEIRADSKVSLTYTGAVGMLGGPPLFVGVEGSASLIDDKATFADHWTKDLERYFPDGIDTPGIVLIKVRARSIRYWDGGDEGEISL